MSRPDEQSDRRWTRAGVLRAVIGGGAVVAGGAATATWSGGGAPDAAESDRADADILNLFLLLEHVQEGFYREALRGGGLDGDLRRFAGTVAAQESEHVARLTARLGARAKPKPKSDAGAAATDAERFRDRAIQLEELTIATYIAQAANLSRDAVAAIVPLVSVEARQVAWVRDLARVSPAPRAADPPRDRDDVLAELREGEFLS